MLISIAMTVARPCRAGAAGLAFVILSASLAAAAYGPRITLGNTYQQWSDVRSGDGQAADPGVPCTNTANCYVLFQPIPQKQPLLIQRVTCRASVSSGALRSVHLRTRKGRNFPFVWTPLVPVRTAGNWWIVNSPAMHLIRSGERPFVWFHNSTNAEMSIGCTVSGTLQ